MDAKELIFRLVFEAVLAVLAFVLLQAFLGVWQSLGCAVLLAHTIGFLFNGQAWVAVRYCRFYCRNPKAVDHWFLSVSQRLDAIPWIDEAVCIGSRGVGTATTRSDIDLRLFFKSGVKNWLHLNFLLLMFRTEALFRVIPLDLYAYDDIGSLDRFDQSEPVWVIKDQNSRLARHLGGRMRGVHP